MLLDNLINLAESQGASDIHINHGNRPWFRINGEMVPVGTEEVINSASVEEMVQELMGAKYEPNIYEHDFSFSRGNKRFRVNVFRQNFGLNMSLRLLAKAIPTLEELHLPAILSDFAKWKQGFILIAGPTGQGKSTTTASILNEINLTRRAHIITLEDPIEYEIVPNRSLISQREIVTDTASWKAALKAVLRQDPDVLFIGEMRDLESVRAALNIAETGHLVFSTLHTNSAAQTINRVVDIFPDEVRDQVCVQFASVLGAVVSQRLVPAVNGGRLPATEIMVVNGAIRNSIRERKTHMIDNVIQTSADVGMVSMERSLAQLVKERLVDEKTARAFALRPDELDRLLRSGGFLVK